MAWKSWDELSDTYRKRLLNNGYTRADHEYGVPKGKARGHAATPEHPSEVSRNPGRYARYIEKNPNAAKQMHALVRQSDKYNIQTVAHTQWKKADKSTIAMHWNAIKRYLKAQSTDEFDRQLGPFEGVTVGGNRSIPIYELETDKEVIDYFLNVQDEPPFEDIYEEPDY